MHNSHEKLKSKKLSQELRHSEKTSADIAHPFLKKGFRQIANLCTCIANDKLKFVTLHTITISQMRLSLLCP